VATRITREQLEAEVAALRALLAAVRDCADVPPPADDADWQKATAASARRADLIAVYANPDLMDGTGPAPAPALHDRAEQLRKEAARPLRYAPKAEAAK